MLDANIKWQQKVWQNAIGQGLALSRPASGQPMVCGFLTL